ncbi:MAG: hypothetical protein JNK82_10460 [Myxococcaceae bacterium]|nr:hypothetical protein [Myxococcaceae bacterium]
MAPNLRPLLVVSLLAFAACGKEKGRVPFTAEGTATTTVTLEAGDVAFWTDLDLKWEGDAVIRYDVEVEQGGKVIGSGACNPLGHLGVKTGWAETNLAGSHTRSGNGKMDCRAVVPAAGSTNVKVTLSVPTKPGVFTLKKADLVIKQ